MADYLKVNNVNTMLVVQVLTVMGGLWFHKMLIFLKKIPEKYDHLQQ
jgi:hypothetical protein